MSFSESRNDEEMDVSNVCPIEFSKMSKRCQSLESCESRETSYLRFVSTLPRLCSPTICGTINYKTPKKWSSMSSLEYKPFEWSIDQKALLDPCDFSNIDDINLFTEIDERIASKHLQEENDWFFSQKLIIPSPKTPENNCKEKIDSQNNEIWSPFDSNYRTPEDNHRIALNRNNRSIECFKTPLNCSKSRQKKKLFRDDLHLREPAFNRSPKDSAFETKDSQSLLSPIYSPDWRNTSLSNRITNLSPIQSRVQNYVEMDFGSDQNSSNDRSMKTKMSFSELTADMLSIKSQSEDQNISMNEFSEKNIDNDLSDNVLNDNKCPQNLFQKYLTKTSTPSHL